MTSAINNLAGASQFVLQSAITGYSDEAYTNAKKLSGTGIVTGDSPDINKDTETFTGQLRWFKPLTPVINIASLTDSTAGDLTDFGSEFAQYVKTVRTHGARKINLQSVVSQEDGLAKIGRDFGETRAQDEHDVLLALLKGVAVAEVFHGAGSAGGATGLGGQTFDNDPTDKKYGFYVDLGSAKPVVAASASIQGAARAEGFLTAFATAYKDYEPEYAYLVTSPEVFASLRSANLVDSTKVSDGNIEFETIFGGKFRLIQTRASQGLSTAQLAKVNTGAGVDVIGTKTSFIVLPEALALVQLDIPEPVEITRVGGAYKGGGTTEIWHRWGYVAHPKGYNWKGLDNAFPGNGNYMQVKDGASAPVDLTAVTVTANTTGVWERKVNSALSLSILPVFHS
ncbi:MAG TPA: hypothetical protein PLE82_04830 [Saccharofermentans sp.]|nr:hypothetical protein [Saccharofermentans sp.]